MGHGEGGAGRVFYEAGARGAVFDVAGGVGRGISASVCHAGGSYYGVHDEG